MESAETRCGGSPPLLFQAPTPFRPGAPAPPPPTASSCCSASFGSNSCEGHHHANQNHQNSNSSSNNDSMSNTNSNCKNSASNPTIPSVKLLIQRKRIGFWEEDDISSVGADSMRPQAPPSKKKRRTNQCHKSSSKNNENSHGNHSAQSSFSSSLPNNTNHIQQHTGSNNNNNDGTIIDAFHLFSIRTPNSTTWTTTTTNSNICSTPVDGIPLKWDNSINSHDNPQGIRSTHRHHQQHHSDDANSSGAVAEYSADDYSSTASTLDEEEPTGNAAIQDICFPESSAHRVVELVFASPAADNQNLTIVSPSSTEEQRSQELPEYQDDLHVDTCYSRRSCLDRQWEFTRSNSLPNLVVSTTSFRTKEDDDDESDMSVTDEM